MLNLKTKNDIPFGTTRSSSADMAAAADGSLFETQAETLSREKAERRARQLANRKTVAATIQVNPTAGVWISTDRDAPRTGIVGLAVRLVEELGLPGRGDENTNEAGFWDCPTDEATVQALVIGLHAAGFETVNVVRHPAAN